MREFYLDKADGCLAAVDRARDPAERAALNRIARSHLRLVDYVGARQEPTASPATGGDDLPFAWPFT
jgi:hypothetical protein